VVTVAGGAGQVLDLETGAVRRELGAHPAGEIRALSADGRWAASSGWQSDRVRLWEVGTGRMVSEWVLGKRVFVSFTPDSRALIIARGDDYRFLDVATLQPILCVPREVTHYPGTVAFSPDGRLMALEMAPAVIHLMEAATGRTVARLEDPYGDRATWLGFTPDGTRLVAVTSYADAIHVWDLHAIQARLKAMNLDRDWPEFPLQPAGAPAVEAATIEAPPRDQAARGKITRWRRAVEEEPDSANARNNLAWAYLTAPEPLRDVGAALTLAEEATRRAPWSAVYRNTLGLAYYRAGRWRESADVLRPNLRSQRDKDLALDLYVLAMSYHRLGEAERARDVFDLAVRLSQAPRGTPAEDLEEQAELRAEAERVLGIGRERVQP
jgi:Tfp pilus assembly protein PilF